MRSSVVVLACAVAVFLGGAALISLAVLGAALMTCGVCAATVALLRDDAPAHVPLHSVPSTLHEILERARAS